MRKQIEVCDWCEDEEAVSIIARGEHKGDALCEGCEEEFIDCLKDEYLNDIEGTIRKGEESKQEENNKKEVANGERRNKKGGSDR